MVRFFAFSAVLLLPVLSALGAPPLALSLNDAEGLYTSGETAVVSVAVAPEILAERSWSGTVAWQRNWAGETQSRPWSPEETELPFPLEGETPGQTIVTVSLVASDDPSVVHRQRIGFLYRPEAIELSTPEPRDFDAFWEEQMERWRALDQEIVLRPVDSPKENVSCWDLTIHLEDETPVSGYLALPEDASPETLPAVLYVHGAGVRSSSLSASANAAALGFLALDINAHGLPNGMAADFYEDKGRTDLANYRHQGTDSRDDWYFRTMYLRVVTALDYLCARPEWNGDDLVIRGSSQGGGQALAGAGLDPRVTVVAASVPALCDLTGAQDNRKPGWPQPAEPKHLNDEKRAKILQTVGYFDGGNFARRIEAPVILSLGLADPTCPAVGIQATLNNLAGPTHAIYRPTMTHAYPSEIHQAFDAFMLDRVTLPATR